MIDIDAFAVKKPLVISGNTKRIADNSMGFQFCSEIIIEEGVEEIGGWAFTCSTVDGATIPSSVKKIEENPFPHTHIYKVVCKSPYYTVKDSILIENDTLRLVSYVGLDKYSGKNLSGIMAAKHDDSQKYEYTIPSYIKVIGEGCFRGRELDKIIIPQNVEKILQNPFVGCNAEIVNHSTNYKLEKGLLVEIATNTLIAYVGKDKDIVVPEGVEFIEGSAFEMLDYGVNSITLPSSIKEIRDNFCEECDLQNIYVSKDKVDFFQDLLPQYTSIIKILGVKEPTTNVVDKKKVVQEEPEFTSKYSEREKKIKEEAKSIYKPQHQLLIFMVVLFLGGGTLLAYLLGSLFSWDFMISEWNIFSVIVAGLVSLLGIVLAIVIPIYSDKQDRKEAEHKARRKIDYEEDKQRLFKEIKESGGMSTVIKDMIDALGYPIAGEGENWITLGVSDKLTIKIEQTSWNHQSVTYYFNEGGKLIEQKQSFKTMGYVPMVTDRDTIIQTIKEKIWSFGLSDKPTNNVKSVNTYSRSACLIRDLFIVAYRNEGKISENVSRIIKSFAKKHYLNEEQVSNIIADVSWNKGEFSSYVLDCYSDFEADKYIDELISIHNYTNKQGSSGKGLEYIYQVAKELGKTEKDVQELI